MTRALQLILGVIVAVALDTGCRTPFPDSEPQPTLELELSAPPQLRVGVTDEQGQPLADVEVRVGSVAARTDQAGNALLAGLPDDEEAWVIHLTRTGYGSVVQRIRNQPSGSHRVVTPMRKAEYLGRFREFEAPVLEVGNFTVYLPANGLVDGLGRPFTGYYQVTGLAYDTREKDGEMGLSPAALLAVGDGVPLDALHSYGVLDLQMTDLLGRPLSLDQANGATARIELRVDKTTEFPEGLSQQDATWWVLNETTGLWEPTHDERDHSQWGAIEAGDGFMFWAEVTHFTKYNVDIRRTVGCANAQIELPEELLRGAELTLRVGMTETTLPVRSKELELVGLPQYKTEATLILNDAMLNRTYFTPGLWDHDSQKCNGGRFSIGGRKNASGAGGALIIRTRSGDCPATGFYLSVRGPRMYRIFRVSSPMIWLANLQAGDYVVTAIQDIHGSTPLAEPVSVTVSADAVLPSTITLKVPSELATTPPGGCEPLPCEGEECNTCAKITVQGEDESPVAEIPVLLPGGGEDPETDAEGQVCVDLGPHAGETLEAALADGTRASTLLTHGSCAEQSCVEMVLQFGSEQECPEGTIPYETRTQILSTMDPSWFPDEVYRSPIRVAGGGFSAEVHLSDDYWPETGGFMHKMLGVVLSADSDESLPTHIKGDPVGIFWGWDAQSHSDTGAESDAGLRLRAEVARARATTGVFALDMTYSLRELSEVGKVQAEQAGVVLTVLDDEYTLPFKASSGTIYYEKLEDQLLTLRMEDLVLQCMSEDRCDAASFTLSGSWTVVMLSVGSFPLQWTWLESYPRVGASALVEPNHDTSTRYGPSSMAELGSTIYTCLPNKGSYRLVGDPIVGTLRPFTPLQSAGPNGARLLRDDMTQPGRRLLAQTQALWVKRELVEALYGAVGASTARLGELATIFGLAQTCTSDGCEAAERGEVRLTPHPLAKKGCLPLSYTLGGGDDPAFFILTNIDPECAERSKPYTLSLWVDKTRDPSFTQLVQPVAGGVMVIPSELEIVLYEDQDGDGFGNPEVSQRGPVQHGWVRNDLDCDDNDARAYPGVRGFLDNDGDGYGDPNTSFNVCASIRDFVTNSGDCDDDDVLVNSGADEECDEGDIDENCNGLADDDDRLTQYKDANEAFVDGDGDGFGAGDPVFMCDDRPGYSRWSDDCDDDDAGVNPGQSEECNDIDDDCDETIDDDDASLDLASVSVWYYDGDSDGFGDDDVWELRCEPPDGYLEQDGDCDDDEDSVYPGHPEVLDALDNDCDESVDETRAYWPTDCIVFSIELSGPVPHLYCYDTQERQWTEAEAFCENYGYRLLELDDQSHNDAVFIDVITNGQTWIGLNDRGSEGKYSWTSTGSAPSFYNWDSDEPNNKLGEDCVEVYASRGKWNDEGCSNQQPFVCRPQ